MFINVLRKRNFALLWSGQLISSLGDWVVLIALPIYTYQITGSIAPLGIIYIVSVIAYLLCGSIAGVFVDRLDRRWTMIISDTLRACIILTFIFVKSQQTLWIAYVGVFLLAVLSTLFTPAKRALVPVLLNEDDLMAANSLEGISDNLPRLLGPLIGSSLVVFLGGLTSVAIIDALSYLISAITIFLIHVPPVIKIKNEETSSSMGAALARFGKEWVESIDMVAKNRIILGVFLAVSITAIADVPFTILIVPLVTNILRSSAFFVGIIAISRGIGGIVGSFITGMLSKILSPIRLLVGGLLMSGFLLLIIINFPNPIFASILVVVAGMSVMSWSISAQTLIQQYVPDSFRGRIFGTYETTISLLNIAFYALVSTFGDKIGALPLFEIAGGLYVLDALFAFTMLYMAIPKPKVTIQQYQETLNENSRSSSS